jgi:hypothetical protein
VSRLESLPMMLVIVNSERLKEQMMIPFNKYFEVDDTKVYLASWS